MQQAWFFNSKLLVLTCYYYNNIVQETAKEKNLVSLPSKR